jgi:hypothetical protein
MPDTGQDDRNACEGHAPPTATNPKNFLSEAMLGADTQDVAPPLTSRYNTDENVVDVPYTPPPAMYSFPVC